MGSACSFLPAGLKNMQARKKHGIFRLYAAHTTRMGRFTTIMHSNLKIPLL